MIKTLLDYLYHTIEIISHRIPFFTILYVKFHAFSVKKEAAMVHLSSSDYVLHIGCGAIPYTAIVLAKICNAKIVGIDHKQRAVAIARDNVKRYGFLDKILIEKGEGEAYDPSPFTVIIIAHGVDHQDAVLRYVFDMMREDTRLILRRSMAQKNTYIDTMVRSFSVCSQRLLLTQESVVLIKKSQK